MEIEVIAEQMYMDVLHLDEGDGHWWIAFIYVLIPGFRVGGHYRSAGTNRDQEVRLVHDICYERHDMDLYV